MVHAIIQLQLVLMIIIRDIIVQYYAHLYFLIVHLVIEIINVYNALMIQYLEIIVRRNVLIAPVMVLVK